jgi:hypothetical protein
MDVIDTFVAKEKNEIYKSVQAFPVECLSIDGILGYCEGVTSQ